MKVIFYPAIDQHRFDVIRNAVPDAQTLNIPDLPSALREIADSDGFVGKINPELLRAAGRLQWVHAPTSSLGLYMFPELIEHSCILTNAKGLFADIITGQVFAYILCFTRNFPTYFRNQQQRRWHPVGTTGPKDDLVAGFFEMKPWDETHFQISDMTLGIVGLGSIGSEVARIGAAFGMRVVAVDPVHTQAHEGVEKIWPTEHLHELLAVSDFVVLAVPHTPQTYKMFRREQFQQMKRTACLINVGRGVVVDLTDLAASLQAGEIGGAGLDVFETEPLPEDHPLWGMNNVIITPHVAAYAKSLPERYWVLLKENVERFAQGKPLRNMVNKPLGF